MVTKSLEAVSINWEKPGYVELVFALVLVWGFGDALSTIVAMSYTGAVHLEANPWIRILLAHNPMWMLLLKGAVALYVGVVLLECRHFIETVPGWRLWFLGTLGVGVFIVISNTLIGLLALA